MDVWIVVIFLCAVFIASIIQGVSGFGFGIFVMTIFPFLFPTYTTGVTISSLLSLGTNSVIAFRMRKHICWKNLWIPVIFNVLCSTLAIVFSVGQSDAILKKMLGVFLILMSIYLMFWGGKIKIRPTKLNGAIAGSLGGILNGLFGMGGPPMVVYLLSCSESNEEYMGTIQTYFTLCGICTFGVRAANGMVTATTLQYSLIGLVALFAGVWASLKVFRKLNPNMLRKIVYGFMILSGIIMLWQS